MDWLVWAIVIVVAFAAAFMLHSPTRDTPSNGERPRHRDLEKPGD